MMRYLWRRRVEVGAALFFALACLSAYAFEHPGPVRTGMISFWCAFVVSFAMAFRGFRR